jgi:uroporphyrin-III C-methyltransferase
MSNADRLSAILAARPRLRPGHVWLAGAGPGDPGMLTLDVLSALGQADVVVHDALVDKAILDLAASAELVFAGKRGGKPSATQDSITERLIEFARAGRRVLRLKGGDPFIFGRGGEEALALVKAGIPYRILPGLTSAIAGLADSGIPATMRGVNKAFIMATGHAVGTPEDLDWHSLARTNQPIVVYMGLKNLPRIVASLLEGGLPPTTPAAVIASATTAAKRIVTGTLATIHEDATEAGLEAPAIIVIGDIVAMRDALLSLPGAAET